MIPVLFMIEYNFGVPPSGDTGSVRVLVVAQATVTSNPEIEVYLSSFVLSLLLRKPNIIFFRTMMFDLG